MSEAKKSESQKLSSDEIQQVAGGAWGVTCPKCGAPVGGMGVHCDACGWDLFADALHKK